MASKMSFDNYFDNGQMYAIPAGLNLRTAILSIFNFYSNKVEDIEGEEGEVGVDGEACLDGTNFVRMCRDAPLLSSSSKIRRYDLDLIFSKAKRPTQRKLFFEDFLQALVELALVLYPDEDPTAAFTELMVRHILGLFDQAPSAPGTDPHKIVEEELKAL